jgi:hypothetical protein
MNVIDGILNAINNLTKRISRLEVQGYGQFIPLTTELTSTSFDGDSFSNVGATVLDLSAVFGVPAGIKAALVQVIARDSAAWGTDGLYVAVGANATAEWPLTIRPAGGDVWLEGLGIVPCTTTGDFSYTINASGTNTMEVYIRIWGYWI